LAGSTAASARGATRLPTLLLACQVPGLHAGRLAGAWLPERLV
jgi:hypothetical protein